MARRHFRLKKNSNTPNVSSNNNQLLQLQQQERRHRQSHYKRDRGPFNPKLWLKSSWEVVTTSLFFSPVLAVILAILLGFLCSVVDTTVSQQRPGDSAFIIWSTNVSSAQTLLSTIAGATISFAGTAFSVSLLVIQLASTQYSPRVVHTLFKDPFNRRIVSLVVGTFTFCLVGLRSLGHTSSQQEEMTSQEDNNTTTGVAANADAGVRPDVTAVVAFLLGIASVLAIVAYIDHAANTMDISQLLERISRDTILQIQRTWVLEDDDENDDDDDDDGQNSDDVPNQQDDNKDTSSIHRNSEDEEDKMKDVDATNSSNASNRDENPKKPKSNKGEEAGYELNVESHVVRFRSSGWVQEIDIDLLLSLVPEQSSIQVHTMEGRYAIPMTAVCSVSPKPTKYNWKHVLDDKKKAPFPSRDLTDNKLREIEFLDEFDSYVLDSIMVGASRTMRCDPSFGLRQLVDVALRALSPGVNDPTTAQDAIFHTTAVVTEFCHRKLPKSILKNKHGGSLILNEQHDYDSLVRLAFNEVRCCVSSNPTVAVYLLESLRLIRESLQAGGFPNRAPEIERQARLIEECIRNDSANIHDDHEMIVQARQDRFDTAEILAERRANDMFA
mmetsp:Transcript_1731/g.3963  ORF Transcript_1731/g.3963 Transcript_1731/m.3963 type:complete len:612 (+) Transcript_1731:181-2016(+)